MSILALEKFDDTFSVPASARPLPSVPNGLYTVTFPDGEHRTFRIHTKNAKSKFAPGERILSLLTGPDNEKSYTAFAFVSERGFHVWKRHKDTELERYAATLTMLTAGEELPGHEVQVSKRCLVCNRTLTTPESLALGIGPGCYERMQGG